MQIYDISQTMRAIIFAESDAQECAKHPSEENKGLIKHFILNSIRYAYSKHKVKYGSELILACDSKSWRNEVFPQYKWKRKQEKINKVTDINWDFAFECFDEVLTDIDKYLPYIVLKVPRCEGDDVIGTIVKYHLKMTYLNAEEDIFGNKEPEKILIQSSDRDHVQLHNRYVQQYSSIEKIWVTVPSPRLQLIEKIVRGDGGDSIPSVRSSDNVFVDGIRQKPISKAYLQSFLDSKNPIDCCLTEEEKVNYKRNELLISYEHIPTDIKQSIIDMYLQKKDKETNKMELLNYFIKNKMRNLTTQIDDFF